MRKKIFYIGLAMILALLIAVPAMTGINDRMSEIFLGDAGITRNLIGAPEIGAPSGTPPSGWGWLYVKDNAGVSNIYFEADDGTVTSLTASASGGVANLDEAYDGGGSGAGATIAVDAGPVVLTGTHATTNTLTASASGSGHVFAISNTGTGKDISGTAGWSVTKAGLGTFASIGAFTGIGDIDLDDGVTASPTLTFTDATDETAAFSKADAGVLSLTTDATDGLKVLTGNLWVGNGTPGTAAMDGEDTYLEGAVEIDGAVQMDGAVTMASTLAVTGTSALTGVITLANGLTLDNAVNNTYEWNENSEEIKWTFASNALDLVSTSGVVELSVFDNSADVIISHSADGAADDFYIKQTGAQDASLFIQSAGTGTDALSLSASAGGIDIDATLGDVLINANAAGKNVTIGSVLGSIYIEAEEDAANAVLITADGGTTSGMILLNDTGTGDESILLDSDLGGITVNANAGSIDIEAVGATDGDLGLVAGDDMAITATGLITVSSGLVLPAEVVAATNVLTADECGLISFLSHATEFDSQLPAISTAPAGCSFEFYVTAAASGANYTVTTGNTKEAIINGIINDNNTLTACAAEDTITFVTGNNVGDHAKVVSDGTSWIITGEGLGASKLTCTDEV